MAALILLVGLTACGRAAPELQHQGLAGEVAQAALAAVAAASDPEPGSIEDEAARRERLWQRARELGWDVGDPVEVAEADEAEREQAARARAEAIAEAAEGPHTDASSPEPLETRTPDERLFVGGIEGSEPGDEAARAQAAADEEQLLIEEQAWLEEQARLEEQDRLAMEAWHEEQALVDQQRRAAEAERDMLFAQVAALEAAIGLLEANNVRQDQEAAIANVAMLMHAQRVIAMQQGMMLMALELGQTGPPPAP